jgi:hypothetical protein
MMRRVQALALLFVAVFVATYVVTAAAGSALGVAITVTVGGGFLWIVALDVRRKPWTSASRDGTDALYATAALAALHAPGQVGQDCSTGYDGSAGCDF